MRLSYHWDIIRSIPNRKCCFIWQGCLYHPHNFLLLFRRDTARHYSISSLCYLEECLLIFGIVSDDDEGFPWDNYWEWLRFWIISHPRINIYELSIYLGFRLTVDYELLHFLTEEFARVPNIDRCLDLIACEDPDIYTSLFQVTNHFTHLVLQLILNCRHTNQINIWLNCFL